MTETFDVTPYLRPPRLDVAGTVALSRALLVAAPKNPTAEVKRRLKELEHVVNSVESVWQARLGNAPAPGVSGADRKAADQRADNAWAALFGALECLARLPEELYPRARGAAPLLETIFPEQSLTFLRLAYPSEWAECERRLQLIESRELEGPLEKLIGPEFLQEVRRAHAEYGRVLGITKKVDEVADEEQKLRPLIQQTSEAITDLSIAIVATLDRKSPASMKAIRESLAPIDRFREGQSRRGQGKGPASDPGSSTDTPPTPVNPGT